MFTRREMEGWSPPAGGEQSVSESSGLAPALHLRNREMGG